MTITGPNAHNYDGGLGELLGWNDISRYDYADGYDAEDHQRHYYKQQKYKSSRRNNSDGFGGAFNNNNDVPQYNQTNTTQQVTLTETNAETRVDEHQRSKTWEK